MTTAARVLVVVGLLLAFVGLWASWRRTRSRTEAPDIAGSTRVEKALLRGRPLRPEDRSAVGRQLTQVAGFTITYTGQMLALASTQLVDDHPSWEGALILGGFAVVLWLLWSGYATRLIVLGRRQGLRPGRLW